MLISHSRMAPGSGFVSLAGFAYRFAFDFQIVVDQLRVDVQPGFEQPDIFIACTEEAFYAPADANASFHRMGAGYLQI